MFKEKQEKPLTDREIIVMSIYKERIGLLAEIAKARANYYMALGKYTETDLKNQKEQAKLKIGSGKWNGLEAKIVEVEKEVEKWKSQIESLYRRLKGLEKAQDEFLIKDLGVICLPAPENDATQSLESESKV